MIKNKRFTVLLAWLILIVLVLCSCKDCDELRTDLTNCNKTKTEWRTKYYAMEEKYTICSEALAHIDTSAICDSCWNDLEERINFYWDSVKNISIIQADIQIDSLKSLAILEATIFREQAQYQVDTMRANMFTMRDSLVAMINAMKDSHIVMHDNLTIRPDSTWDGEAEALFDSITGKPYLRFKD